MTWLLALSLLAIAAGLVVRKIRRAPSRETFVSRGGKFQRADAAFDAWTSGDLPRMLSALNKPTNPVDRHFLLLGIVEATYRERRDPKKRSLFLEIARKHVAEFPSIAGPLRADFDGNLPRVPTFQYLATVLAEDGEFEEAVAVCESALAQGLHDGTKSGFEGRISRIRKSEAQSKKRADSLGHDRPH